MQLQRSHLPERITQVSEATEADDRINYNVAAAFRCETGDKELFEPADHWIHVTPQERSVI